MEAGLRSAQIPRAQHRHELRGLTYVILDQSNGGVVRDLTSDGMGLQVMTAVPPGETMQVRFELRNPRLHVETRGEVVWSTFSGLCGMRFLDVPLRMTQQIREWIFADMLESASRHAGPAESIFAGTKSWLADASESPPQDESEDGLMVSATPLRVIEFEAPREPGPTLIHREVSDDAPETPPRLEWLCEGLSARGLAWTVNLLVVLAGLLLFAVVFLAFAGQAPPWPVSVFLGMAAAVTLMYWGFFQVCGGSSLGTRLARMIGADSDDEESASVRFR